MAEPADRKRVDEMLRQSEERFRLLVEGVLDYAIFMLDAEGHITTWNTGAERIYGYRLDEIRGQHFSRFYPPEPVARDWPAYELRMARHEGRFEDEGWRVRSDGVRFWASVVITALRDPHGGVQGFAKVTRDLTERRIADDKIRAAHTALERRVQERTAELARTNDILTTEINQRQRLEQELRHHVVELQERDAQKNEFLAVLAHELRDPLAPMRTATEYLRLQSSHDPAMRRASEMVDRQVHRMARLIDDLLDLSRLTYHRLQLRKEWVDLSEVVDDALEVSRGDIESKSHDLMVTLPRDRISINVDPSRLAQVLSNLLSNAVKFTPHGGRISLTAEQHGAAVTLTVRDNGRGLPADNLERIFEMFAQVGRSWSNGGLGIGLALVKGLVQLHGGTVEARSDGADRGSEFTVRLPVAAEHVRPTGRVTPRTSTTGPVRRTVVVAEDNHDLAESLSMVLSLMGSDVRIAHDGAEALEMAEALRPDAVLLDIGLPKLNGYEAARCIREQPWGKDVLLLAMTGWGQDEDRRRTSQAGFNHHLVKPVDPAVLHDILSSKTGSTGRRSPDERVD